MNSSNVSGHINLLCRNFNLETKQEKEKISVDSQFIDIIKTKRGQEKEIKKVYSSDKVELISNDNQVKLKIYDHSIEDGDKIDIILNKKLVLQNLELTKKGVLITLSLISGKNKLIIKAKNEGSVPMNTSKLELYNESNSINNVFMNILKKNNRNEYEITY